MIFAGQSREQLRATWVKAWERHGKRLPLSPLEAQLVALLEQHPEYHAWLTEGDDALRAPATDASPFLHLSLHLALREQVATDRPTGIKGLFNDLCRRAASPHQAEHRAMTVLGSTLWEAQRSRRPPDEAAYLAALKHL